MSSFGPFTGQLGSTFFITEAELPSVKQGCRVATSEISGSLECLCGVGCHKEFPFKTRTECEASLKGEYVCYSSYTYVVFSQLVPGITL